MFSKVILIFIVISGFVMMISMLSGCSLFSDEQKKSIKEGTTDSLLKAGALVKAKADSKLAEVSAKEYSNE